MRSNWKHKSLEFFYFKLKKSYFHSFLIQIIILFTLNKQTKILIIY
jgi:hypothetical protein